MNRVDLRELSASVAQPSVTITLSFAGERHRVDHLRHMVGKARAQLVAQFPDASSLIPEIHIIESQVDITRAPALLICINKFMVRVYELPFTMEDEIVIGSMFATQKVASVLNRTDRFWVVLINKDTPYLFEGSQEMLIEVVHRHTSWYGEGITSLSDAAGKTCPQPWDTSCRYTNPEDFIKKIDEYLSHLVNGDPLPLVLVADKKNEAAFLKYSKFAVRQEKGHTASVIAVHSAPVAPEQLHALVFPHVQTWYKRRAAELLKKATLAREAHMITDDALRALKALQEDRVTLLCVERDFFMPGCEDRYADQVVVARSCDVTQPIDIIDSIIEAALSRSIPVAFYDHRTLAPAKHIIAVWREK